MKGRLNKLKGRVNWGTELLGLKNRFIGVLGALSALIGGVVVYLYLTTTILPGVISMYMNFFSGTALVNGIIPYHIPLGNAIISGTVGLGTYLLILGGVLGLIGNAMSKK